MPKIGVLANPYWQTRGGTTVRLYLGDVLERLRQLPSGSVQCVVTSPPYWGLRDYGTGVWEGGDPKCEHKQENRGTVQYLDRTGKPGKNNTTWQGAERHATVKPGVLCRHCGAVRVNDHQLGSEARPDCLGWARGVNCAEQDWATGCHVCRMVLVFREVRRVLRDDGTCWLNYGDSYNGSGGSGGSGKQDTNRVGKPDNRSGTPMLKQGNLVGVPWRVALALQADGWVLRQDIIWHKPSPMPESVQNRCTKAHEYVFLLTKGQRYYCDMEAIKEPLKMDDVAYRKMLASKSNSKHQRVGTSRDGGAGRKEDGPNAYYEDNADKTYVPSGSNKRSVWSVPSQGYPGAHFATFPPKLIEPMILAGTSARGCCAACGTPWQRVVESTQLQRERPNEYVKRIPDHEKKQNTPGKRPYSDASTLYAPHVTGRVNTCANTIAGVESRTLGWRPDCECYGRLVKHRVKVVGQAVTESDEEIPHGSAVGQADHSAAGYMRPGAVDDVETKRQLVAAAAKKERWVTVMEHVCVCGARRGFGEDGAGRMEACQCDGKESQTVPCVVLDPFIGSGTTAVVCLEYVRHCIGIDLSRKYLDENAIPRIKAWFNARPAFRHLVDIPSTPRVVIKGRSVR